MYVYIYIYIYIYGQIKIKEEINKEQHTERRNSLVMQMVHLRAMDVV